MHESYATEEILRLSVSTETDDITRLGNDPELAAYVSRIGQTYLLHAVREQLYTALVRLADALGEETDVGKLTNTIDKLYRILKPDAPTVAVSGTGFGLKIVFPTDAPREVIDVTEVVPPPLPAVSKWISDLNLDFS